MSIISPPSFEYLHLKTSDSHPKIWELSFHHGKANEVGSEILHELDRLNDALYHPQGPMALISSSERISKSGKPIFIAGANVTERSGWDDTQIRAHVRRQRDILARLRKAPIFHVCIVHGIALGWGAEFLITADYKIATSGARFGLPETGLGILPGAGGTSELAELIGVPHALRLGMTGEQINRDEAFRIGLVQEISHDLSSAKDRANQLCEMVTRKSPTALAAFKHALLSSRGTTAETRMELEALAYERCVDSGDAAIGRASFSQIIKGETPQWGLKQTT